MWETRSESAHGHCLKHATHGIRSSSAGAGGYQNSIALLRAPPSGLGGGGGIACIRPKASCTEPRGPYRDDSVRLHVPCHP